MKQLMATAFLATVALFGLTADTEANCGGKFRRCKGGCESACAQPCAPVATVAVEPKFEDRKVKVYKQVMKEKEVDVLVCKQVMKDVPYTYTVCTQVMKAEKRMVAVCTPTMKEVDYSYTVMVPKTTEKMVKCVRYECVRENIVECVPVCKTVCVTCVDECGRCHTRRERVTVMEERTRCVTKRIAVEEERKVLVCTYDSVVKQGKKTVCEYVHSQKEVTVNVCSYVNEPRQGVRKVCETVTEKVKHKVQYCETVVEETTVRVQVGGAACATPCNDCTSTRGGLFRRGHGKAGCSSCN